MQIKDVIEKGTKLYSIKYYDKDNILRAKVSTTKIGLSLKRKELELQTFKILEENEINCKGEDFEQKVVNEVRKNENLTELKQEVMKNED
jgi:hypothetical protein